MKVLVESPSSRRIRVPLLLGAALAVLAVGLLGACGGAVAPGASPTTSASPTTGASDVVARVDGAPVTRAQVDAIKAEARLQGRSDATAAAREEAVRRVLVRREAARLGVTVTDAAVARRIARLEQDAGGKDALDSALGQASMTRDQLTEAVRYSLLSEALARVKGAGATVSAAAVRSFYERNRQELFTTVASYRLGRITVPGERLAQQLVRRLRAGADFEATAKRYSMDEETRYQGGELGWVSAVSLPAEALAVIARTAPGHVADPVLSSGRWQVFKVFGRRPGRTVPFAEARRSIAAELVRRKQAAALKRWLAAAEKRADVVTSP